MPGIEHDHFCHILTVRSTNSANCMLRWGNSRARPRLDVKLTGHQSSQYDVARGGGLVSLQFWSALCCCFRHTTSFPGLHEWHDNRDGNGHADLHRDWSI